MAKSFKSIKTTNEDDKWEDKLPFKVVDIRKTFEGGFKGLRLVGFVHPFMRFWVPTEANKAYDPYKLKAKMYPAVCVDFDPETEDFSGSECLYRKANYKFTDPDTGDEKWGRLKPGKNYLVFFIDRDLQDDRQGLTLEEKVKNPQKSDIQCAIVPTAFVRAVQSAIDFWEKKNKVKDADPTDPDNGFDLFFQFDDSQKAEAKYQIQTGDSSPLTKAERRQCALIPSDVKVYPKDGPDKIRASLERSGYVIVEPGSTPEEAEAEKKANKGKPNKTRTMKAGVQLSDDDEDAPRKKKAPAASEEEDFEDEDDDLSDSDDDDEEEEVPVPKAKPAAKPAVKKAPVVEEDELEEEEEVPAPKAKAKKTVVVEVDEDEEEEAPAPKAKAKPAPKPVVEDDDDNLDFGDLDDED